MKWRLLLFFIWALIIFQCGEKNNQETSEIVVPVRLAKVVQKKMAKSVIASGRLTSSAEMKLSFKIGGIVESVLNELDDIRYISSSAQDGMANVSIEFESGTDSDEKYSDVLQKVSQVRPELPEDIHSLSTFKWTVSDVYILQLALISETASYRKMESEAERIKAKTDAS